MQKASEISRIQTDVSTVKETDPTPVFNILCQIERAEALKLNYHKVVGIILTDMYGFI